MGGQAELTAFTDPLVFDGSGFWRASSVVVARDRITGINVQVPSGANVLDASASTLLPGFIDSHVHIGFFDPARVLAGGVTVARDTGWTTSIFDEVRRLATDRSGPLLLAAGPMITAPGGYPSNASWAPDGTALEINDTGSAREAVRWLASLGSRVIKVAQEPRQGPVLEPDLLEAVVREAHRTGLKVTSHCGSLAQLEVAIDAGIDELAHGLWSDESIPDPTVARMVAAGMAVVPTLHIDPSPSRIDDVRRFLAAGGHVVYGTDMGNQGPPPGIDHIELDLMLQTGMSLEEALRAATSAAARYLDLQDRGIIGEGAVADLVIVDGDPRDDLQALTSIRLAMREGISSAA